MQPDEAGCSITAYTRPGERFPVSRKAVGMSVLRVRKEPKRDVQNTMKKILLSIVLAVAAPFAWAQVSETTTTTTTTEGNGTITDYSPGSTIVLKETSGPRTYRFGKTVTYVTRSGNVLDPDVVKTKVRVGVPVHVHYAGTGDNVMVDRVIVDED